MRILLLQPCSSEWRTTLSVMEPLGLCYVGAVAKEAGHAVKIIHQVSPEALPDDGILEAARAFAPDLVGLTAMTDNFPAGLALAGRLKAALAVPIVFGGEHVTSAPESVADPRIDYAVLGEGEFTFRALLEALERGEDPGDVAGVAVWRDGAVRYAERPRATDLDALPWPLRDELPVEEYRFLVTLDPPPSRQRVLSIGASRGCVRKCTFCSTPGNWGPNWVSRSVKGIVDEMQHLEEHYGATFIFFRDEFFTLDPGRVAEVADLIAERGLTVKWGCFATADSMTIPTVDALVRGGCVLAIVGAEAGSEASLERMKKGVTRNDIVAAMRHVPRHRMTLYAPFILGFPWETEEDLWETYRFARSLPLDFAGFHFLVPYPGTEIERTYRDSGLIEEKDPGRFLHGEPLMRTETVSRARLIALHKRFRRGFYTSPAFWRRTLAKIARRPALLRSYAELFRAIVLGMRRF